MANQSLVKILKNGNPRMRVITVGMTNVVILAILFLVFGLAPGMKSVAAAGDVPECGSQPICGYLQAHSVEAVTLNCDYHPICAYLKAHNSTTYSVANDSLSTILAAQPKPGVYETQLAVENPTLVRSGPGQNFYSYGELPAAFVSRLIGVSQLGNWWAIPLPLTAAPDGMGWVDAASVSVSNVATAPIDPPACKGLAYCGYLQAHSQPDVQFGGIVCSEQPICSYLQAHNRQNLPVLLPSYATERLLGMPVIVVTGK